MIERAVCPLETNGARAEIGGDALEQISKAIRTLDSTHDIPKPPGLPLRRRKRLQRMKAAHPRSATCRPVQHLEAQRAAAMDGPLSLTPRELGNQWRDLRISDGDEHHVAFEYEILRRSLRAFRQLFDQSGGRARASTRDGRKTVAGHVQGLRERRPQPTRADDTDCEGLGVSPPIGHRSTPGTAHPG